jgi:aspartyl-tRNA(Asn)/glutamyl-tRNA(Gln) amidotransferase subunit A
MDLSHTDLRTIQTALSAGTLRLPELVEHYLKQIDAHQHLNAYVEVFREEARERARILQQKLTQASDPPGPLLGAVLSIKDNICYAGHSATASSAILQGFHSEFSATAVERLLEADAIIIGRTNCDEFGMGSDNQNSTHGPVSNALDPSRVPGGSSGGAAVSVQTGSCLAALASDTGGSVRQPAAFCGLYGLKPTYGRISRHGLIAYASSFDQIGLIGNNPTDIATILSVIEGPDEFDATCSSTPSQTDAATPASYRICYFRELEQGKGLDPTVQQTFLQQLDSWGKMGHQVEAVDFPLNDYLVAAYYVLTTAEASSNLSRFDGVRYGVRAEQPSSIENMMMETRTHGFGSEVKRRILLGTFVLSAGYYDAYYAKAQKVRRLILESAQELLGQYDFIASPTSPVLPWHAENPELAPIAVYLADIFTVYASLAGIPALSFPASVPDGQLPVGIQLNGSAFSEQQLLQAVITLAGSNPQ